ncbi:sensor histidine kinase [Nocardioides hwasunensis]|uniref:HAMP domain-containing histidine kinase n=1 Tax=Nocardioides hwasunensis TaxID=397258 RepID=A0ABR8MGL5_9ACTN|nr:HAMP domain-containing sensor histidine kinase [Nocardioides hwasunensis]MBD3915215.1 HAMP domain-containing histidine kinase [Nocardioides hwasunensis]
MRESAHRNEGLHQRVGARAVGVLSFMVLVWTGWGGMLPPSASGTSTGSVSDGLVSGLFVAGAGFTAVASWRRHRSRSSGWLFAVGALVALQALLVALPAVAHPPPRMATDFVVLLTVGVAGLGCLLGALRSLREERHVADDLFGIGLGLGLMAAGHLLLLVPVATPVAPPMLVLVGVLVGTHATAAALVVRQRVLSPATAGLVVATVLVVAAGLGVMVGHLQGSIWDVLASLGLAAVGAAWLGAAWSGIQQGAERTDTRRRAEIEEEIEFAVQATERDRRERMHELRSTLAGLVQGSSLLDSSDLPLETRQRLLGSVRRELDRMVRLLSGEEEPPTDLDLDEALGLMVDLQHLKGRKVELQTSGAQVTARYDSLAEVVNILVDNAATHGGTDTSRVEVVRRDDTVDITVTDEGRGIPEHERERIFGWGDRGADSPGEGIGLNLAQRLVAQEGGSLRLAEPPGGAGSSFVISLPATRQSAENRTRGEVDHVAGHRAG